MSRVVLLGALFNLVLALVIVSVRAQAWIGMKVITPTLMSDLAAWLLAFLGVMLLLTRTNLFGYASFVFWDGGLRLVIGILLVRHGRHGELGWHGLIVGIVDLLLALVFLLWFPSAIGSSRLGLLTGRPDLIASERD